MGLDGVEIVITASRTGSWKTSASISPGKEPGMRALVAACCVIAAAPSAASAQGFVGRTWLATDVAAPPGTLRIFLADGTLLMDSCGETYRLAKWRTLIPGRIAWTEDGARIEAEVSQPRAGELRLRLHLRTEIKVERYRLAKVPFVCPDSRPSPVPPR
jgi:hypothetical protein